MESAGAVPQTSDTADATAGDADWLVCVDCGARIAPTSAKTEVGGAHRHEFTNPAAVTFVVRCFAIAPGARGLGERSKEWTWFPNFAWEIELCRRCLGHVGWSFHGATTFYGVIADRVIAEQ